MTRSFAFLFGALVIGCSHTESAPDDPDPSPGCPPGELVAEDGSCLPAGVDECGDGFEHDGEGCVALLPADVCPVGLLAVPGDTQCRSVGPCPDSTYGADASESAQHVDSAYSGGSSDGSAERPWTDIQTALDNAPDTGTVVVAEGTYPEDLVLSRPVTLSGRCAERVVVSGAANYSLRVLAGASGSIIRDIAISGPESGVWIAGAANVLVERVRIFDTGVGGFLVGDVTGSEVTLRDSLVETPGDVGAWVGGGVLTLERSAIRGSRGSEPGRGLMVHQGPDTNDANVVTVRSSVIEDHDNAGITFSCGALDVAGTVVRYNRAVGNFGGALGVSDCMIPEHPTSMVLRDSVFEHNGDRALALAGVDATIETITVRDTTEFSYGGEGIRVQQGSPPDYRVGEVFLSRSLVQRNAGQGIILFGATLSAERIVVRDTAVAPQYPYGHGLHLQVGQVGQRANASVRGARFVNNAGVGVLLLSGDATLEHVAILDELPIDAADIHSGVLATYVPADSYPSQLHMHGCEIVGSLLFGAYVLNSQAQVTSSRFAGIRTAFSGRYGDGIAVSTGMGVPEAPRGSLILEDSVSEDNARAGLASFGADVVYSGNRLSCNTIAVNGEADTIEGNHHAFYFDDRGGNMCGCGDQLGACDVLSNALDPLEPPLLNRPLQ